MNKTSISIIAAAVLLTGCAGSPLRAMMDAGKPYHSDWAPVIDTTGVVAAKYQSDDHLCRQLASSGVGSATDTAFNGAAMGAIGGLLIGAVLGVDVAEIAAIGAMSGGAHGLMHGANNNEMRYREILVRCLRDKGYRVY